MNNKILIAKPGKNVLRDTDPDDLIFSSDYNTLKYDISGSYQMTNVTTTTNAIIPHNLGYVPFFLVYCEDLLAQNGQYALTEYFTNIASQLRALRAYVDDTNLYLSANLGLSSPATVRWSYKIFKNNLGF